MTRREAATTAAELSLGRICGQQKRESRSAQSRTIARLDSSAVRFDDGFGNRQAQAHPAVFRREEVAEYMRQVGGLYSRAVIFNAAANHFGST